MIEGPESVPVTLRDGSAARILGSVSDGPLPLIGARRNRNGVESVIRWTRDGHHYAEGYLSNFDIVEWEGRG
jgi:hypothetical protein